MDRAREPLPTRVEDLPELPASARRVLAGGLAELGLDDLPDTARAAMEDHLRLMLAWNAAINLTAIRDPDAAARLHVIDSLTAMAVLRTRGIARFLDLGSGAGFPGLPLAIALPAGRALLVESVAKKARFLSTAVAALGLEDRVEAFPGRAEALAADAGRHGRWPAVLVRAVGSLADLVELALPLLDLGGILVAWKRGSLDAELEAADNARHALGGGPPEIVAVNAAGLEGHRLVVIAKRHPTPPGFPRDPAIRARNPW